ncbi:hypothetical protein R9X47_08250 [Wukongibacter baidiensis]
MNGRDIAIMIELMITLCEIEKTIDVFDDEITYKIYNVNEPLGGL